MTPGSAIRAVHTCVPGSSCRPLRASAVDHIRRGSHPDASQQLFSMHGAPIHTTATRAHDAGPCGDRDAPHRGAHDVGNVAATVTGLTP